MVKRILLFLLIISNIGCDQISKELVRQKVKPNEIIQVYKSNVILTKVQNTGAALGLGQNLPPVGKLILINFLPLSVLVVICFWVFTQKRIITIVAIALAFIIGGGLGNLIDRFLFGSVTDFFLIEFGLFKTGIFNMADVSVTIGALLILMHILFSKKTAKYVS